MDEVLTDAYRIALEQLDPTGPRDGTTETAGRAARAMRELTSGYRTDIAGLFKTFDAGGYDSMVVVSPIPFASLCEHHLLPFVGTAHVAYVPSKKVIGLSKIPRLVDAFSRRLQIQERLTEEIAEAMQEHLEPLGVLVMIEAEHACATLRGVRKSGVSMRTSALRGSMLDNGEQRAEAYALIGR